MDLKQYKEMIANQILNDVKKQIEKEKKMADGSYNTKHVAQYENIAKNVIPKRTKKVIKQNKVSPPNEPDDDGEDNTDQLEEGGKIHFLKHMKKFGRSVTKFGKKAGKAIENEVVKQGAKELGKVAIEGAKGFMTYGVPALEESAPLLLAAGMQKRPRKTRNVSEKEKRRHTLVKKIMNEHKCSLPQASKHIKENNLSY